MWRWMWPKPESKDQIICFAFRYIVDLSLIVTTCHCNMSRYNFLFIMYSFCIGCIQITWWTLVCRHWGIFWHVNTRICSHISFSATTQNLRTKIWSNDQCNTHHNSREDKDCEYQRLVKKYIPLSWWGGFKRFRLHVWCFWYILVYNLRWRRRSDWSGCCYIAIIIICLVPLQCSLLCRCNFTPSYHAASTPFSL